MDTRYEIDKKIKNLYKKLHSITLETQLIRRGKKCFNHTSYSNDGIANTLKLQIQRLEQTKSKITPEDCQETKCQK